MSVTITTLIENSPGDNPALKYEHGLSFFIEKDDQRILFDTGQSAQFIENAKTLDIDLTRLDHVVVSHGHYDHSGGLKALLEINTDFKLHFGKGFFALKYGVKNGETRFNGNNFDEAYLLQKQLDYDIVDTSVVELVKDVYLLTNFERTHDDEVINPRFLIDDNGQMINDTFSDEVMVVVNTERGLVVILGCAHPGMKNMVDAAIRRLDRPLYAILGGTHLVEADETCMQKSLEYLHRDDLAYVGVSHCTGEIAMKRLQQEHNGYFHNHTGKSISFD